MCSTSLLLFNALLDSAIIDLFLVHYLFYWFGPVPLHDLTCSSNTFRTLIFTSYFSSDTFYFPPTGRCITCRLNKCLNAMHIHSQPVSQCSTKWNKLKWKLRFENALFFFLENCFKLWFCFIFFGVPFVWIDNAKNVIIIFNL